MGGQPLDQATLLARQGGAAQLSGPTPAPSSPAQWPVEEVHPALAPSHNSSISQIILALASIPTSLIFLSIFSFNQNSRGIIFHFRSLNAKYFHSLFLSLLSSMVDENICRVQSQVRSQNRKSLIPSNVMVIVVKRVRRQPGQDCSTAVAVSTPCPRPLPTTSGPVLLATAATLDILNCSAVQVHTMTATLSICEAWLRSGGFGRRCRTSTLSGLQAPHYWHHIIKPVQACAVSRQVRVFIIGFYCGGLGTRETDGGIMI